MINAGLDDDTNPTTLRIHPEEVVQSEMTDSQKKVSRIERAASFG
jgi:hypothetical protein